MGNKKETAEPGENKKNRRRSHPTKTSSTKLWGTNRRKRRSEAAEPAKKEIKGKRRRSRGKEVKKKYEEWLLYVKQDGRRAEEDNKRAEEIADKLIEFFVGEHVRERLLAALDAEIMERLLEILEKMGEK